VNFPFFSFAHLEPFGLWPATRAVIEGKMQSGSFHFSIKRKGGQKDQRWKRTDDREVPEGRAFKLVTKAVTG
jgi:hypothetical protein